MAEQKIVNDPHGDVPEPSTTGAPRMQNKNESINEMLLSHQKEGDNATAATWMDLEIIVLSESERKRQTPMCYHLHVKYKIRDKCTSSVKHEQNHRHREQTHGCQGGGGWGRDEVGV